MPRVNLVVIKEEQDGVKDIISGACKLSQNVLHKENDIQVIMDAAIATIGFRFAEKLLEVSKSQKLEFTINDNNELAVSMLGHDDPNGSISCRSFTLSTPPKPEEEPVLNTDEVDW